MTVSITHEELQRQVTELLAMMGWEWLHVRKSAKSTRPGAGWVTTTNIRGWPDLAPIWSRRQPGRHLAIEIKVPPDKLKPDQERCAALLRAGGFEVRVVTPDNFDDLVEWLKPLAVHPPTPAGSPLPSPETPAATKGPTR